MKDYFVKNYRTFLSIVLSLLVVLFVIPFFMTPGKVTQTFTNFSNYFTGFNLSLPTKLFTLNINSLGSGNPSTSLVTGPANQQPNNNSYIIPTAKPRTGLINQTPTQNVQTPNLGVSTRPTTYALQPTTSEDEPVDFPEEPGAINNLNNTPTSPPLPTKRPKPSPTPLAPPEYLRPGTSLDDIFKKAGELSCVPAALLKAFVANEAPGVLNWSQEQAMFYNAYDWWHRVKDKTQVCAGYGFYTHTGLIAEDSLFANERCKEPFSPETANDTYSRLLGSCQMLKSYWDKDFAGPTKQKLKVSQVDRRVLIDCLVGYGIHFRVDSGYTGPCENWALKDVAKAACVNTGVSCDVYNYCYRICNNYNKYANKSFNCDTASSFFVPGTCQFK